jgi:translocation and assembly module TamA
MVVASYPIEELSVESVDGWPRISLRGAAWGGATVAWDGDSDLTSVEASLDHAVVAPALAAAIGGAPEELPAEATATGELSASFSFPVDIDVLSARSELRIDWSGGAAELTAWGAARSWHADRVWLQVPGGEIEGSGRFEGMEIVEAEFRLASPDPARMQAELTRWWPGAGQLEVAGGALEGVISLRGDTWNPAARMSVEWRRPHLAGAELELLQAEFEGSRDELLFTASAVGPAAARLDVDGVLDGRLFQVSGDWNLDLPDVEGALAGFPLGVEAALQGSADGGGEFWWGGGLWGVSGELSGTGLGVEAWRADRVELSFEADPEQIRITELEIHALGGGIEGSASLPIEGFDGELAATIGWHDIDTGALPVALSSLFAGSSDGVLELRGSLARPEAELELEWQGHAESPVEAVRLHGILDRGVLRLMSEELASGSSSIIVQGTVPLGSLPRPEWLWPGAPSEAVEARIDGRLTRIEPVLELMLDEPWPVDLTASVSGDLRWDPRSPDQLKARVELLDARVLYPTGELVAEQPLDIQISGRRIELEPARLVGPGGGLELGGWVDLEYRQVSGFCDAVVSPEMARLIPYPVRMHGPLSVSARIDGRLESPTGTLNVDHAGGLLSLADPALEIGDLRLAAEIFDGAVYINDGSATVNRGRALLVGGWDPDTGQGVVLELDNTTFYVEGILSRWSGLIAIEPDPERVARIVGDLVLDGGVWDQPVDIGGALLGSGAMTEPAADDPLRDLVLDISVRGRGGIRVENNLGRFDIGWDRLHVGGTAARPVIEGDIRISPGGTIILAGSRVTVQRGTIRFTGNPAVDPVLEIVPVESLAAYAGSNADVSALEMSSVARTGLAQGIGTVLGFQSDNIEPAEIAVETESTSSERFMVGRRVSRNVAFFFTTDLANVQDTTTMLQLWNLPMLSGLAVQGYQETLEDRSGVNIIQRFRWGGSKATEDRPEVGRIRFEGDWPLGRIQRKRSARLRRGDPYDPFLLFVTEMRLERELAAAGYQLAEVTATAEGRARLPELVFYCVPGESQLVEFEGADPPREIRRQVVSLYQPPPLDEIAMRNMRQVLLDHYRSTGHREAEVTVEWRGERLVAEIEEGREIAYQGPILDEALSVEVRGDLAEILGTQRELAAAVTDRARVAGIVSTLFRVRGYHDARLVEVAVEEVEDGVERVRLEIDQGERRVISKVELSGKDPLGTIERESFYVQPGSPLDRITIDRSVSGLRRAYQDAGYVDVRTRSMFRQEADGSWVVELELDPGRQRKLADVTFTGQRHTWVRHLRKGVVLEVGDTMSPGDVDLSAVRVAEFSPVERVDVVTRPVGDNRSELEVAVTEKPRWTVEVGGGYNSDTGIEGRVGLRDDNLLGRGLGLNLRGKWNERENLLLLYGSLPPLPGGRLSFLTTVGIREGDSEFDPDQYSQEEKTGSLEASWRLRPGSWARAYYRFTTTRTFEKEPDPFVPFDVTTDVGTLGLQYVHDRFDNPFDPRRGWGFTADVGWSASHFGSDLETLRTVVGTTAALSPIRRSTWVQSLRLGDAQAFEGTNLDPQLRFFAGGQGSVRGFDRDSLGPSIEVEEGRRIAAGGGALFVLNEELRLPLSGSFRAAAFADIGQVWESWSDADGELAVGAGVGIRWSTPIGLIWGDVAWPVANRGISSAGAKFYLGIGKPF